MSMTKGMQPNFISNPNRLTRQLTGIFGIGQSLESVSIVNRKGKRLLSCLAHSPLIELSKDGPLTLCGHTTNTFSIL